MRQENNESSLESLNAIKGMLSQSEAQEAVGRVVIHISSINTLAKLSGQRHLENEDRLVIPRIRRRCRCSARSILPMRSSMSRD